MDQRLWKQHTTTEAEVVQSLPTSFIQAGTYSMCIFLWTHFWHHHHQNLQNLSKVKNGLGEEFVKTAHNNRYWNCNNLSCNIGAPINQLADLWSMIYLSFGRLVDT